MADSSQDGKGAGGGGVEVHEEQSVTSVAPPPRRQSQLAMRRITRPSFLLDLVQGSQVGEYEIEKQIGEGAMGTVYTAVHPLIGKRVAVKVLKPELCANQASLDRFLHEAQAVNKIGHPNIVDVFSFNELPDGRVYFVMEWLRGEDLKTRLARGPLSVPDACDVLDGIARALEAAHAKEIVHRDLKPDNVFLNRVDDGPIMVKLLDFGIAKLVRQSPGTEKTQTGNMLGTPRYISPEQARGIQIDHRADIYSLGAMAYEMLAGRAPFVGETAMDIVVQHISEPAPALATFAKVPRALEQCVMRMLDKDPGKRPTLEEVRRTVQDPSRRPTPVAAPVAAATVPNLRRSRWPIFAAAIAGAFAVGGVTWWIVFHTKGDGSAETTPAPALPVVQAASPPVPPSPAPAPPAPVPRAMLEVHVTGAKDATILVDGQEWGRGETVRVEVQPGGHDVVVRPRGRAPLAHHVDVVAGQLSTIDMVVPSEFVSRPVVHAPVKKEAPKPVPRPPDDDDLLAPKGRGK